MTNLASCAILLVLTAFSPAPPVTLQEAEAYEKAHPHDKVGQRDLYESVLSALEPDSASWQAVKERLRALETGLTEAYRVLRKSNPRPELSNREVRKLATQLKKDLRSRHADVRLRAAQYLGLLDSTAGAQDLVNALANEKEGRVADAIAAALIEIGGDEVCKMIGRVIPKAGLDAQKRGLHILRELMQESDEKEDKAASLVLGGFVLGRSRTVTASALTILEQAGGIGSWGLMRAVQIGDHQMKLRIIASLGRAGEGRAAVVLGGFLDIGVKGLQQQYKIAAAAAIKQIGVGTVPYLVRFIEDPKRRHWAKKCLYDITGQSFERADQVWAWWGRYGPK